ncbi:WhiB family transcriptional regulator [Nocardioides soli]|uniref:4Fe-4S Wbl-type domain-containing protein n=1 Tax=Nocardioides soli TaxID=1036020 RepID=A0A7W4VT42_9ACTN|nr:WhiB family transcriptional regulator [Nocardioides soli]MBB3041008.1 hypothetical protein [Nocardioides soli]
MALFHVPDFDRPACAKPEHLPLVDAAYRAPGGPEGQRMRDELCTGCPAGDQCLAAAMTRGEWGAWGGSTKHARTRHGAARTSLRSSS